MYIFAGEVATIALLSACARCAERKIRCTVLETRNGRNLGGRIDLRSIPDVLQQATDLHRKARTADAEIGYRRILEVQPKHADALHRLGQLLAAIEPAIRSPVRSPRNGRDAPDRRTAQEHAISL